MTRSLYDSPSPQSPVLSPDTLRDIGRQTLEYTTADTVSLLVEHRATGTARVSNGLTVEFSGGV